MTLSSRTTTWLSLVLTMSTGPCCDDTVEFVTLSLSDFVYDDEGYATIGDTVTVWSSAETLGSPSCVLYVSRSTPGFEYPVEPDRFVFSSSDPEVASFADLGFLSAHAAGQTLLTSTTQDVSSAEFQFTVSPPVSSISVTAGPSNVAVGDTIQVDVRALDESGEDVPGAHANIVLVPGTDDRARWDYSSIPRPFGQYYATPFSRRFVAARGGVLLITAIAAHLNGRPYVVGDTARVEIFADRRR